MKVVRLIQRGSVAVNKASPYSRGHLNPWAPVTAEVEEGLRGVALLQEVRHWGWA